MHLACHCYFVVLLKAYRATLFVLVVEDDGHCSFSDPSLPLLVYQFLQTAGSHLTYVSDCTDQEKTRGIYFVSNSEVALYLLQICNAQDKAYRI